MHARAASILSIAAVGLLTVAVAGCNDDGRTLRPARPDQGGSVSTLAPVTDPPDADGFGELTLPDVSPTLAPAGSDAPASVAVVPALTAPFAEGGPIDARFTCDGNDISPPLTWTAAPEGTIEIALTLTDLDAPGYVHWVLAGIDPLSTALGEGNVPEFALTSTNSGGTPGYAGPCPPAGETHQYEYTVHFLAQQTELSDGSPGADMLAAVEGATFASASVVGTYSRT